MSAAPSVEKSSSTGNLELRGQLVFDEARHREHRRPVEHPERFPQPGSRAAAREQHRRDAAGCEHGVGDLLVQVDQRGGRVCAKPLRLPIPVRTGSREAPAARRADERPPARRPLGRQRTLPARPVAGSDRRHPRRPRQGRRRLRGDQGEHPRRGQARHADEGHDHALRAVRRGRARPDLRAHPRGPLARARASGRKLGRPKGSLGVSRLDGKEEEIRHFLELGVSKTAIAKITGGSRTALYSFMTTRGLRPSR